MTRLIALLVAVLFALSVPAVSAQTTTGTKPEVKTPAKPEPKADTRESGTPKKALLDINTASVDELKALPAIGDTYSQKIVDNRPYKRKDELVTKKVVPEATYNQIKDQIVARQDTAAPKKPAAAKTPAAQKPPAEKK
jgi:competence protein ComEA